RLSLPPHPPHIRQEVPDQLFRCREFVAFLDSLVMPMVPLSRLIVVQHKAFAGPAVEQAVFESMTRTADGARYQPQCQFRNRAVVVMALAVQNAPCPLHMTSLD